MAGRAAAVLPAPTGTGPDVATAARGTLGSDPKSLTEPAGHPPVGVGGWLRMTRMMIGDPSWRAGGRLAGDGSGPSGVTLLQPATARMRPAASALARTDSGPGGRRNGISLVLPRHISLVLP